MNEKRPKLNIPKTRSEWIGDIIGYTFYLGSLIFLIYIWPELPKEVPAHYNAAGEVDRWGSKWELLILPGVGLFILVLLQLFEKFPEWHNYPKKFTESNAKAFYLTSRKLMNQLKNLSLIVFALILYNSVAIALKWNEGFNVIIFPLFVVCFLLPVILSFIRFRRIS